MIAARPDAVLVAALERAQQRGWIGSGALERHIGHARAFATRLPEPAASAADLGSGGGLPGLVLALDRPATHWTLIDSSSARVDHLIRAVGELDLGDRVEVVHGRAERLAHDARFRERFDAVVARSFGPPAVTAEVAAGLVAPGGRVVVSDPPAVTAEVGAGLVAPGGRVVVSDPPAVIDDRWPAARLIGLGLRVVVTGAEEGTSLTTLEKTGPAPDPVPRVTAALHRRPRW